MDIQDTVPERDRETFQMCDQPPIKAWVSYAVCTAANHWRTRYSAAPLAVSLTRALHGVALVSRRAPHGALVVVCCIGAGA